MQLEKYCEIVLMSSEFINHKKNTVQLLMIEHTTDDIKDTILLNNIYKHSLRWHVFSSGS